MTPDRPSHTRPPSSPSRGDVLLRRAPTAPLGALGLIGGFAIAVGTGSRPLGGVFMAICGLGCIAAWVRRDGRRTAGWLTAAGLFAFALSHLLGLAIGAWPSVLLVSAAIAWLYRRVSDARISRPPANEGAAAEPRRVGA